jgi:virginiamycin B lyase
VEIWPAHRTSPGRNWCLTPILRCLLLTLAAVAASGQALPEGDGKDLVEAVCTACHEASNFTSQHMTKPQWQAKVLEMLQECPDVTQAEREKIVDYLATNFPPVPPSKKP